MSLLLIPLIIMAWSGYGEKLCEKSAGNKPVRTSMTLNFMTRLIGKLCVL